MREGLEACDDGNDVSGDGCSIECVVETSQRTPFVAGIRPPDIPQIPSASKPIYFSAETLAVSATGIAYVGWLREVPGEGGTPGQYLTKVLADGSAGAAFDSGLFNSSEATLLVGGEDLFLAASVAQSAEGTYRGITIVKWTNGGTERATVFSRAAASDFSGSRATTWGTKDFATFFFVGSVEGQTGYWNTVGAGNVQHVSAQSFDRIYYEPVRDRLLGTSGTSLVDIAPGTGTSATTLYTFGMGQPGRLHSDGSGKVYVVCTVSAAPQAAPCAGGAVWIIDPSTGEGRPYLDGSVPVADVALDPSTNDMVVLYDDGLYRVSRNP